MADINKKKLLGSLLLGTGVIIATPLLSGIIPAIVDIPVLGISIGAAISAGTAAFLLDMGINRLLN